MYSTHNSLIPYPYLIGVLIDVGKPVETMSAEHGVDVINVKFAQAGSGREDEFTNKASWAQRVSKKQSATVTVFAP